MSHLGERLTALIDGELGHDDRERALAHLAGCEQCRTEADGLRRLKSRLRALAEPAPSAGMLDRLLALGGPADDARDVRAAGDAAVTGDSAALRQITPFDDGADGTVMVPAPASGSGARRSGTRSGTRPGARSRQTVRTGGAGGSGGRAAGPAPRRRAPGRTPVGSSAGMFAAAAPTFPSLLPAASTLTPQGMGALPPVLPAELTLRGDGLAPIDHVAGPARPFIPGSQASLSPMGGASRRKGPLARNLAMGAATFALFGAGTAAVVAGAAASAPTPQPPRVAPVQQQRLSVDYALTSARTPAASPTPSAVRTEQVAAPTTRTTP